MICLGMACSSNVHPNGRIQFHQMVPRPLLRGIPSSVQRVTYEHFHLEQPVHWEEKVVVQLWLLMAL